MKKIVKIIIIFSIIVILNLNLVVNASWLYNTGDLGYWSKKELQKNLKNYEEKVLTQYSYSTPGTYVGSPWIPQGLAKVTYQGKTYRLITSYYEDNSNKYAEDKTAVVWIYDSDGNFLRYIFIEYDRTHEKSDFTIEEQSNHSGGITEIGNYIIIVSTNSLLQIPKDVLFNKPKGGWIYASNRAECTIHWKSDSIGNYSFCSSVGDYLWIGTHVYKGQGVTSFINQFIFNQNNNMQRVAFMQIPQIRLQGIAFSPNKQRVAVTQTDGGAGSNIYIYDYQKGEKYYGLKTLIASNLVKEYKMPCGAQNIYATDSGNLYILFESGAPAAQATHNWHWIENRVVLFDLPKGVF